MNDWRIQSFCRQSLITGVALKKIKAHPKDRKAIDEALEIERFFRSGWYSQLTSVDGDYLIKRLQDEVRQSESIRGRKNKSNRR